MSCHERQFLICPGDLPQSPGMVSSQEEIEPSNVPMMRFLAEKQAREGRTITSRSQRQQ